MPHSVIPLAQADAASRRRDRPLSRQAEQCVRHFDGQAVAIIVGEGAKGLEIEYELGHIARDCSTADRVNPIEVAELAGTLVNSVDD